jgi:hypothetical protein
MPNVVWDGRGGTRPADGYRWLANRRGVELVPSGTPHRTLQNVFWDGSGRMRPAKGHIWVSDDAKDGVRPIRHGEPAPSIPNTILTSIGHVEPAPGYVWASERPDLDGLRVITRAEADRRKQALATAADRRSQEALEQAARTAGVEDASSARAQLSTSSATRDSVTRGLHVPSPVLFEINSVRIASRTKWPEELIPMVRLAETKAQELVAHFQPVFDETKLKLWNLSRDALGDYLPGYQVFTSLEEAAHLGRDLCDLNTAWFKAYESEAGRVLASSGGKSSSEPAVPFDQLGEETLSTLQGLTADRIKADLEERGSPAASTTLRAFPDPSVALKWFKESTSEKR